jgi:hypothetical protein
MTRQGCAIFKSKKSIPHSIAMYHSRRTSIPQSPCDWKAAFNRDELIAQHGADRPLPELLSLVAAPGCSRVGSQWDRCGAYYVAPIDAQKGS